MKLEGKAKMLRIYFGEDDKWKGKPLYRAVGCLQCGSTGYSGRVALYEVMPVHGLGRVLLHGSTDEIFDAAVGAGMRTLREDGVRLSLAGVTTLEEVRRVTGDRRLI